MFVQYCSCECDGNVGNVGNLVMLAQIFVFYFKGNLGNLVISVSLTN